MRGVGLDTIQIHTVTGLDNWAQVAQIVIACFTVILAAIAIWGDAIRRRLLPPYLVLKEHNFAGDYNTDRNGNRIVYYHLKLVNKNRSPAHKARVLCQGVSRRTSDGETFKEEPLVVPIQLNWSFMRYQELLPTVGPDKCVDLGYLFEGSNQFEISLITKPGNFKGSVTKDETLRYKFVATADNQAESEPMYVQISWNGIFSFEKEEMSKHLVVTKVNSLG